MEINIKYLLKIKEGILMYALVPNIERPPLPHYNVNDTEEEKLKKNDIWKEELKIFDIQENEVISLHLDKANLTQQNEE